jgi:ABC-type transport system involved in cytochrome bd biosynthesis fused ATPase/permease subunit
MPTDSAITLIDLDFTWPDGTVALERLNATLSTGRTGLVGANGSGKVTSPTCHRP